jgi:SnoaL-like domain
MSMNKLPAFTIAAQQEAHMHVLRAGSYQLDAVYLDAYGVAPQALHEGTDIYRALFSSCPDGDLAVTRTIAGAEVVVQEWTFSGTHTGRSEHWALRGRMHEQPTGSQVSLRGVSIYDIRRGLVQRETIRVSGQSFAYTSRSGRTDVLHLGKVILPRSSLLRFPEQE